jgi:hypothetical protein
MLGLALGDVLHINTAYMALNYLSSICIVFFNKWVYLFGFPSVTLTVMHFATTALGLQVRGRRASLGRQPWTY